MSDLSESIDRLLPFARAVIAASMELEKYEPLEAALEERLSWLRSEVTKAEAQRTAAVDEVAAQKADLAKARTAAKTAEDRAKEIISGAEAEAAKKIAEAEREIAKLKDLDGQRKQRLHDDLEQRIDKLTTRHTQLDQQLQAKKAEHEAISTELQALKARFG